jgi:hypothetical protein
MTTQGRLFDFALRQARSGFSKQGLKAPYFFARNGPANARWRRGSRVLIRSKVRFVAFLAEADAVEQQVPHDALPRISFERVETGEVHSDANSDRKHS